MEKVIFWDLITGLELSVFTFMSAMKTKTTCFPWLSDIKELPANKKALLADDKPSFDVHYSALLLYYILIHVNKSVRFSLAGQVVVPFDRWLKFTAFFRPMMVNSP